MSVHATAAAMLEVLGAEHPAAAVLLSPLGRRAALPLGIPQQAAQAQGCERQATIGQITTGTGQPLTLPAIGAHFAELPARQAFLYAPTAGLYALRKAWQARLAAGGIDTARASLPVVTSGMSHGLSLVADLFSSPCQPLVLATPYWDNYETIWNMRNGAPLHEFPFFDAEGRGFNLAGMSARLAALDGPATLLLNFPNNPTGYAPTAAEAAAIVTRIHAHPHPLCVLCDDAYHGLYFGSECYGRSLFADLVAGGDPKRLLVAKVDGATKELVFFGGRVGFLTFGAAGRAGEVLADKAAAVLRGTISSGSAPAQSAVLAALGDPQLSAQQAEVHGMLHRRYEALHRELAEQGVDAWPFNAGCFAMIRLKDGQSADDTRRRLIAEQSTGVIAVPAANALRVAFCSVDEADIPDLVRRIRVVVNSA
jgi:aspartate/methionine/tyrosine aminotransferase